MRSQFLILIAFCIVGCATKPPKAVAYRCEAFCYLRGADGALERMTLRKEASTEDGAWSALQHECKKTSHDKNQADLQVSTSDTSCEFREANRARDCRALQRLTVE